MKKICHFISAHDWNDDRVFLKECQSLAKNGYEVYLVAEGVSREIEGVHVVGCGDKPTGRKARILDFAKIVYEKAKSLDCDVYHFHDPELLPYGIKLKKAGKKVIFDSHEDVPAQIMSKYWIPAPLRWIVSKMYKSYESYAVAKFDAVVAATPAIAEKFHGRAKSIVVINNYPRLDDIVFQTKPFYERPANICYAGGLDEIRGGLVMVEAMDGVDDVQLVLAGSCDDNIKNLALKNRMLDVHDKEGSSGIKFLGRISRKQVNDLYGNSRGGIVLYQPEPNHINAQPIKMYEYMAAGLPVVASNFPLWKEIIEDCGCGICVDPTSADEVREACIRLVTNPDLCREMGLAGRKSVMEKYNWNIEEKKLVELYDSLYEKQP